MAVLPEGVGLDVTLHHVEKPTRTFLDRLVIETGRRHG